MNDWASGAALWQMLMVSITINAATVVISVALWHLICQRRQVETRALTARDVVLSVSTTVLNGLALVLAWWLWKQNIVLVSKRGLGWLVVETIYLVVGLDLVMYCVHRAFHLEPLYGWFHKWHHTEDEQFSSLSLFVMHPLEPFGFAVLALVLLLAFPVSMAAIGIFFTLNLIVGTLAHVPPVAGAKQRWLGGSVPHAAHHDDPNTSFGFFTQAWDHLLGTAGKS